mgnify:CR=1 FL=1
MSCRITSPTARQISVKTNLPYKTVDDLYTAIESKATPKKMAMITHDKDTDDKGQPAAPHVHVMMAFDNARSLKNPYPPLVPVFAC